MTALKIYTQGSPVLKKKSKAVKKILPSHQKIIDDMLETMKAAIGVGLAAPQIGVSERIIVVDIGEGPFCLINPKIVKKSGKQIFCEACLSVPGLQGPVERFDVITVKAMDRKGKTISIHAQGYLSVVFQHEIDHLDGILFIDRVKDPSLITIRTAADTAAEKETI